MDAGELLKHIKLLPVLVIKDDKRAVAIAETLWEAGIRAIEITLRTEAALPAIEQIARSVPDLLLGAGSIRRPEQFAAIGNAVGVHQSVGTRLYPAEIFPG